MSTNGYLEKRNALKAIRNEIHYFERARIFDAAVITLGQMGVEPEYLHNFAKLFLENEAMLNKALEVGYLDHLQDSRPSKKNAKLAAELKFAKAKKDVDEEILKYIYPEDYLAFDYRYGLKPIPEELRKDIYGIS